MSLSDLLALMKRYRKLLIAAPVICMLITGVLSFIGQSSYTATASFVTSGDLALAQGLANNVASSYSNANVKVSCSAVSSSKTINVTSTGNNPNTCIEAANSVAAEAVKQYKEANSSILATVSEAGSAVNNDPSYLRSLLAALVGGLIFAAFIILLLDLVRAPIRSSKDIETISAIPVIEKTLSDGGGERLLANLHFFYGGKPSTVAIVPVGVAEEALIVSRELAGAMERSDIRVKLVKGSPAAKRFKVAVPEDAAVIVSCDPLEAGMGAAYIAHSADVTILCVSEWADSKRQLSAVIKEMELAKANIAGIACLPEEQGPQKLRGDE